MFGSPGVDPVFIDVRHSWSQNGNLPLSSLSAGLLTRSERRLSRGPQRSEDRWGKAGSGDGEGARRQYINHLFNPKIGEAGGFGFRPFGSGLRFVHWFRC
jgi:hypothetical protein